MTNLSDSKPLVYKPPNKLRFVTSVVLVMAIGARASARVRSPFGCGPGRDREDSRPCSGPRILPPTASGGLALRSGHLDPAPSCGRSRRAGRRAHPMVKNLLRFLVPAAVLPVLLGCATESHYLADAEQSVANADWHQAWASIQLARESQPEDPQIERAYWKIRTAWLLWRAQQLVFHNRDLDALADLEKVLALDPENEIALAWKAKAIDKLALRQVEVGEELRRGGQLEEALTAYHAALSHQPGNPKAEEGLLELGRTWQKQRELARAHYLDGIRALSQQMVTQAQYHLTLAITLDPTLDEASDPLRQVRRQLADEQFALAQTMFESGAYDAARVQLLAAQASEPNLPGAEELLARVEAESETTKLIDLGQMDIARGQLAKAREQLEHASTLTQRQKSAVEDLLLLLHERELDAAYFAAKDIELQGRLEEALVSYVELSTNNPGFRDSKDRIAELRLRIEEAKKAYDAGVAAEAAGDHEAAISQFTAVLLY